MKSISTFTLILISIIQFGFMTMDEPKLGKQIYEAIHNNDLEKVKSFLITQEEMEKTVENSEMNDGKKADFISDLSNRIKSLEDKKNQQIEDGFNQIRTNIASKNCEGGIQPGEIKSKTHKLRDHIEIGYLHINYSCETDTETIKVTVIRTDFGWRILENLTLLGKE